MLPTDNHSEDLTKPFREAAALVGKDVPIAYYSGPERRSEVRDAFMTAVALNDDHQPTGDPFSIVTWNITGNGIALIHYEEVKAKYLALQIPNSGGEKMRLVAEVLRCRPVGKLYNIGAKFVARLK